MTFKELTELLGIGLATVITDTKGELTQQDIEGINTLEAWKEVSKYCEPHSHLDQLAFKQISFLRGTEDVREYNPFFYKRDFPPNKATRHLDIKEPDFSIQQWEFLWEKTRGPSGCPYLNNLAFQRMVMLSRK